MSALASYTSSSSSSRNSVSDNEGDQTTVVEASARPEPEPNEDSTPGGFWRSFRRWWDNHSLSRVQIAVIAVAGIATAHLVISCASEDENEVNGLKDKRKVRQIRILGHCKRLKR